MPTPDAANLAKLLGRYRPVIQFDSHESYLADRCDVMTDYHPAEGGQGNVLKSAANRVLAAAAGKVQLRLGTLRGDSYQFATPVAVSKNDYLDAVGKDYVRQARRMHRTAGYADTIHGHAVLGEDGHVWLQYWFFHYYNDKAFLGIGLHEGDWEMIQLRLGDDLAPTDATYAQHKAGERSAYGRLEMAASPDGPVCVVYSGLGSHASYFTPGSHPTELPVVIDHNDGRGWRVRPALVDMDGAAWAAWPGYWGSTRADSELESDSPRGPSQHGQWRKPVAFHEKTDKRSLAAPPKFNSPAPPAVSAKRVGDRAVISWHVQDAPGAPAPTRLLLTVNSAGDDRPPATQTIEVDASGSGTFEHALPLEPREYQVLASAVAADGAPSESVRAPVE